MSVTEPRGKHMLVQFHRGDSQMLQHSHACCVQDKHIVCTSTLTARITPSSQRKAEWRTVVSVPARSDKSCAPWVFYPDSTRKGRISACQKMGCHSQGTPRALLGYWNKPCSSSFKSRFCFSGYSLKTPQRVRLLWGTCLIKAAKWVTWDRSLTPQMMSGWRQTQQHL